jgi:hypothetical protein
VLRHLGVRHSWVALDEFAGFTGSPKLNLLSLIDNSSGRTPARLRVGWQVHSVCQIDLRIRCVFKPLV